MSGSVTIAARRQRLAEFLVDLCPPDERAELLDGLLPEARRLDLVQRDAAIRAALELMEEAALSVRAKQLSGLIDRHLSGARWRENRGKDMLDRADARTTAVHLVVYWNGGNPLRWRRIYDIARGSEELDDLQ